MYQAKPLSFWQRFSPTGIRTMADCVTPNQLVAIRSIANSQRIIYEDACRELFGCKVEELNKGAAGTFIDWLKAQPQQSHPSDALVFCPACRHLMMRRGDVMVCVGGHEYEIAAIVAA